MLTGAIIILAELVALFRLALPDFLDFAERRHDEVYGIAHGDWPRLPTLDDVRNFHDVGDTQ